MLKNTHEENLHNLLLAEDFVGLEEYGKSYMDAVVGTHMHNNNAEKASNLRDYTLTILYRMEGLCLSGVPEKANTLYEDTLFSQAMKSLIPFDYKKNKDFIKKSVLDEYKLRLRIMYMKGLMDLRLWGHALTVLKEIFSKVTDMFMFEKYNLASLSPVYHKFFSLAGLVFLKNEKFTQSKIAYNLSLQFFLELQNYDGATYSDGARLDILFLHVLTHLQNQLPQNVDTFAEFKEMMVTLGINYDDMNYHEKGFFQYIKSLVVSDETKQLECLSKSFMYMQLTSNPLNIAISQYRLSINPLYQKIDFPTKPNYEKIRRKLIELSGCHEDDWYDDLDKLHFVRPMLK